MYMVLVRADLQELDLLPRLDLQTYLPQDLIDGRIEHRSTILGREHQMIQQNRDVIALVDLAAHPPRLRRKRRRMQPAGILGQQTCEGVHTDVRQAFYTLFNHGNPLIGGKPWMF